ncbi:MAG: urate hydroxylase PuuD, partial [Pseudomonadaceae bacterium]|nr:urate hydroxylase PuuD [Pseudomonadaceae bacterium]
LGKRPALLGAVLFVLLIAAAYGFNLIFSGRAAYIHVGAIIGTIMVGNVFFTIMPAQRALVKAIEDGTTPDPSLPAKGLLRSRHNNYLTLPVLFIMISNHFPSTYGSQYNWLILAGIAMLAVLVRHYFNTRHDSSKYVWTLPAAALGMICLAFVTGPSMKTASTEAPKAAVITYAKIPATAVSGHADVALATEEAGKPAEPAATAPAVAAVAAVAAVEFARVNSVIQERCSVCHAATPSSPLFSAPPAGFILDTPEQIKAQAAKIHAQSVASHIMPLGNITQMTQEERDLIGLWIAQGAQIN